MLTPAKIYAVKTKTAPRKYLLFKIYHLRFVKPLAAMQKYESSLLRNHKLFVSAPLPQFMIIFSLL
jgi:hypothetical protein